MTGFSNRLQRFCSYSGTAGRDDFLWGSLLRIICIGVPYIFIGTVYFVDLGFEAETLQGALALSIWMIPYQLLFNFPLAMRRWRDLNGKLHARWLLLYFIYCILPNISDLTGKSVREPSGSHYSVGNALPGHYITLCSRRKIQAYIS